MADRVEFHWHRSFHFLELIEHNNLSLQAGGLLARLVCIMFSTGQPIKNDIAWITRRTSIRDKRTVRKALDELIEQDVIIVTADGLTHPKTMQEIANHSAVRAENGSKRGQSSKADEEQFANSSPSDADLMAIKCQTGMSQVIENVENTDELLKEKNQSQKTEEKKDSPLPPKGGGDVPDLFRADEPAPEKPAKAKKPRVKPAFTAAEMDALFAQFVAAYPEGDQERSWDTAKTLFVSAVNRRVDPQAIIAGAARYREEMRNKRNIGTQFVKIPYNWLKASQWKDYSGVHHLPVNGKSAEARAAYVEVMACLGDVGSDAEWKQKVADARMYR
jgi:uncharacterized protein YdaU (DUF1376 family)